MNTEFQVDARRARYAILTGAALLPAKTGNASVITTLLTGRTCRASASVR